MSEYRGILITNAFLHTNKFVEHYEWLEEAAKKKHMQLDLMDSAQQLHPCGEKLKWLEPYDFVLFWDKDTGLGKEIKRAARQLQIPMFNDIDAIATCDDKYETYYQISNWNDRHPSEEIRLLPTIIAPMTYANIGYSDMHFLNQIEAQLGYPIVVKESFGSFGMQVYLAHQRQELEKLTWRLAGKPFVYQKYNAFSSGRDVRIQVVGNKVIAAMHRQAPGEDFRANITNGGSMKEYQASEKEKEIALKAAKILGLDFAGVDLLFSEETGQADILCEINSNAHFKNIYTCTGINVADAILEHVQKTLQQGGKAKGCVEDI